MDGRHTGNMSHEQLWLQELHAYAPQSRILQKWTPAKYMASGTFSRIFLAVNRETGERCALKFVPNPMEVVNCAVAGSQEDAFYKTRYAASQREAEIMNRFRGAKNIVQYREEPEYLERSFVNSRGETVRQYAVLICMPLYHDHKMWLDKVYGNRQGVFRLGIEMAQALMLFEEKGVYHRDIKPGNILMDDTWHFYLSDVGEAKLESEFTTTGFHGTRPYMAPEVYNQENEQEKMRSDHRSDIYSLGIILYRLYNRMQFPFLTEKGELTESASTSYQAMARRKQLPGEFLTASERARLLRYDGELLPPPKDADEQLAQVILRACAYHREDRYQTAKDLRDALVCCAEGKPLPANLQLKKMKPGNAKKGGKKKKGNGAAAAVLAVGLAALAGGGAMLLTSGTETGLFAAPTATPTLQVTAEPVGPDSPSMYVMLIKDSVNLRNTPSSSGISLGRIPRNTLLWVLGEAYDGTNNWYYVDYNGQNGYVRSDMAQRLTNAQLQEWLTEQAVPTATPTPIAEPTATPTKKPTATPTKKPTATPAAKSKTSLPYAPEKDFKTSILSDGTLEITGYTGNLTKFAIPEKIGGKKVTSIGDYAFYKCSSLTSIEIPKSVTSIGRDAFNGCSSLRSIELPESVTGIGSYAFNGCSSLRSIEIPEGVTSIGNSAFSSCSRLTSIELPESVTSIRAYVFDGCSSLTSIELPESVTSIGSYAFDGCSSLTSIEIPESVTSIGGYAFNGCSSLQKIYGVYGTEAEKLAKQRGVEFVSTKATPKPTATPTKKPTPKPTATPTKKPTATPAAKSKTSLPVANEKDFKTNVRSNGVEITGYTGKLTAFAIPEKIGGKKVTSIGYRAFDGHGNLTSIELPDDVTSIGNYAFYDCSSLTSIELPESVTSIGSYAFRGCSSLTSIEIPESVTSIGFYAFYGCSSLTSIELPESVTSIGDYAFYGCSSLQKIYGVYGTEAEKLAQRLGVKFAPVVAEAADFNTRILLDGTVEIAGYTGRLTEFSIPETIGGKKVTSIGLRAFSGSSRLTSIKIPECVTNIGDYAFYHSDLTNIELPDSLTSIGMYAFSGCGRLTSIQLPDGVTNIGSAAFSECSSLSEVFLPKELKVLRHSTFYGCRKLTNIVLPEGMTSIGNDAFSYCSSLTSIKIPKSVKSIEAGVLTGCSRLTTIYGVKGSAAEKLAKLLDVDFVPTKSGD